LLRKCLQALSQQSLDKSLFEVIVVSDGADGQTEEVVSEYRIKGNFTYYALPQKKGPAAARNLGWLSARSPVIAFTDDDCLPDKGWLENILAVVNPAEAQAFTGRIIVPRDKRPTDHGLNTAGLETADFVTANCICTKKALTVTGGFDERFSMAWREDSDLEFKLISNGIAVNRIPTAIVVHPIREAKWGVSIKEQKKTLFNALLYRKYPDLYRNKIQAQPPYLYYLIISGFLAFVLGLVFSLVSLSLAGCLIWLSLTAYFIIKRLYRTSLSAKHILEMIYTSFLIPFCSIYWQWYGAVKYRTLLI
jgi:glycosyltransferase involved in cell wall biosynthesis